MGELWWVGYGGLIVVGWLWWVGELWCVDCGGWVVVGG